MNNFDMEFEKVKDSKGKIRTNLIPENVITEIKKVYKNYEILTRKELIVSFYKGFREVPKCKNNNCSNFVKWKPNTLSFGQYCCPKCSNSDPKKDETTVKNNLEKYGVPRASMTETSKAKLMKTNLERFGCVSSAQHQSVKDKALKTNFEKYGHVSTEVGNIINLEQYNDKDFINQKFIKDGMFIKDEFMEYFNCCQVAAHNTLSRLGILYKKYSSSKETEIERKVKKFLNEYNIKFLTHYRDSLELDFFLPDYNIGIECDGLYYHSYGGKSTKKDINYYINKHVNKFNHFMNLGISTIFLWENEVLNETKFGAWKLLILEQLNLLPTFNIEIKNLVISIEYPPIEFLNLYTLGANNFKGIPYKIMYKNNTICYYDLSIYDNKIILNDFVYNSVFIQEKFKIKIFQYLSDLHNKDLIIEVPLRFGTYNFYNSFSVNNLIIPKHYIFKISGVARSKNINLATNIPIEYLKDEENYAMIYDYDLDYYDNLKLNGFNSLWDCGSIQYTIPFRRINE